MKLNEQRYPHLAALESFEDSLRAAFAATGGTLLRPRPDLLQMLEPQGETFISAVPVPQTAQQDEVSKPLCMLTMTASLKSRPRLTDEQINACNRYVGLSLLSRPDNCAEVMAVSAFTIYEDPMQRSQMLYLSLQATVLQRLWLSQVLSALENDFRRPVAVLDSSSAGLPSKWTDEEIASIFKSARDAGYRVRQPDPHGIMLHLSKSTIRGQGSFIILRNDLTHPFYGNGLSVTLVLPAEAGVSREQLERRALSWNRGETLAILPTPCIGAWASSLNRSQMQHSCFLPNVVYASGLGQLALDGAIQRWAVSGESGTVM